jgi:hypothetical protein
VRPAVAIAAAGRFNIMIATRAEILVALGLSGNISDPDLALLDLCHRASDAAVRGYLQQELGYQQHEELLPVGQPITSIDAVLEPYLRGDATIKFVGRTGMGSNAIVLKNLPVYQAGLTVWEDVGANAGQAEDSFTTPLLQGDDYWLDVDDPQNGLSHTGILYRMGYWPTEPRSVKVRYYAGASAAKLNNGWADIKQAAILAATEEFQNMKRRQGLKGVKQSESIGQYSYSLGQGGVVSSAGGYVLPPGVVARLFRLRNMGRLFV